MFNQRSKSIDCFNFWLWSLIMEGSLKITKYYRLFGNIPRYFEQLRKERWQMSITMVFKTKQMSICNQLLELDQSQALLEWLTLFTQIWPIISWLDITLYRCPSNVVRGRKHSSPNSNHLIRNCSIYIYNTNIQCLVAHYMCTMLVIIVILNIHNFQRMCWHQKVTIT